MSRMPIWFHFKEVTHYLFTQFHKQNPVMLVCNHLYYLELLWTKGLFIPQTETYPKIS